MPFSIGKNHMEAAGLAPIESIVKNRTWNAREHLTQVYSIILLRASIRLSINKALVYTKICPI